jgi:hypothetical protein
MENEHPSDVWENHKGNACFDSLCSKNSVLPGAIGAVDI